MASGSAVSCVERATSDLLIGPDWAINIELCDVLNSDPRQTKDVMKILKKRLGSKSPQIQLLALFVLETLSKNCGDYIYVQIVERDVLHEMTKIVKKKPDFLVKEKILSLVDAWQYAFSGSGNHPHYFAAYQELLNAGMKFPPREDNAVPLFTPPQTHPIVRPEMLPHEADVNHVIQASLQDVTPLSSSEIQNVHETANVLMEMLSALHPHDREALLESLTEAGVTVGNRRRKSPKRAWRKGGN
ncbi:hypothetical protein ZOSMA_373G00280 [Zostera marina]|uniref:VHS domain-containing protein n=1 Tax=Zostera marina TaxID=29655 RepID=A0A0K9P871_ZOSMR|nr:hypothetical protein ZOSMA_373G00280 [Zostera marina]